MIQHLRVGIPVISRDTWQAGFEYVNSLVKGLNLLPVNERPKLTLIITDSTQTEALEWLAQINLFDEVIFIGKDSEKLTLTTVQHIIPCNSLKEAFNIIDFYFPAVEEFFPGKCVATWIPEMKHVLTPDFFSPKEFVYLHEKLEQIANMAPIITFSSAFMEKIFFDMCPSCKALSACLPLGIYPEEEWYTEDVQAIRIKYGLPSHFLLCVNTFSRHKNVETVFNAIASLRQTGKNVHLVCAAEEKSQDNEYVKVLMQYSKELAIEDRVHIVSGVSYQEKIQLIRCSLLVIQPSLLEEFDNTIDLCQALGKPITSSDIVMHQDKMYGTYFAGTNASQLAENIAGLLSETANLLCVDEIKQQAFARNRKMAEAFCRLAEQSQFITGRNCYKTAKVSHKGGKPIVLATSLAASKDIKNQYEAVASWKKLGFSVTSINSPDEIDLLQPQFPDINFVRAHRDVRAEFGKPYIYFDDILSYLAESDTEICGIINSDIHLHDNRIYSFVRREAPGSLLYGSRIDVAALNNLRGKENYYGFDYFFFDRELIPYYPKSQFCIGLPYWDYWIVLIPLFYRIPAKRMVKAQIYHIRHPEKWLHLLNRFEKELFKYFTRLTYTAHSTHVRDFFCQLSSEVSLDETTSASGIASTYNIDRLISPSGDVRIINGIKLMLNRD